MAAAFAEPSVSKRLLLEPCLAYWPMNRVAFFGSSCESKERGQCAKPEKGQDDDENEFGKRTGSSPYDAVRVLAGDRGAIQLIPIAITYDISRESHAAGHQFAELDGRMQIAEPGT